MIDKLKLVCFVLETLKVESWENILRFLYNQALKYQSQALHEPSDRIFGYTDLLYRIRLDLERQ